MGKVYGKIWVVLMGPTMVRLVIESENLFKAHLGRHQIRGCEPEVQPKGKSSKELHIGGRPDFSRLNAATTCVEPCLLVIAAVRRLPLFVPLFHSPDRLREVG